MPFQVPLLLLVLQGLAQSSATLAEMTLGSTFVSECVQDAIQKVDNAYKYTAELNEQKLARRSISPSELLSIFKKPVRETRSAIRAAEYMDTALNLIQSRIYRRHKRSINATDLLSAHDIQVIATATGCGIQTQKRKCKVTCFSEKYRTITGQCNNRKNPRLGASNTPFARWLAPQYEDGFFLPRGWNEDKTYNGFRLPQVRDVSNKILYTTNLNFPPDQELTHMFVQWGQWLDHDAGLTPQSFSLQTFNDGIDCQKTCAKQSPCFPIKVPPGDPRINQTSCLPFFRSSPVCGSGELGYMFGDVNVRQQMNALTSFIDGSMVYGSTETVANSLRVLGSPEGLMDINKNFTDSGLAYLPFDHDPNSACLIVQRASAPVNDTPVPCFIGGDVRASEQLGLVTIHTLFVREHNGIAKELKRINPHWSGEIIFQETRKIVGAMQQIITYRDFLPHVVGTESMQKFLPPYQGYNESVNPTTSNVFTTAAFRFGHGMLMPKVPRQNETFQEHPLYPSVPLHNAFFATWRVVHEGGIGPIIRGLLGTPAKQMKQDQVINNELRDRLFELTEHVALDLAALNMQRGRDHAIPAYNDWRQFCTLSQPKSLSQLGSVLNNPSLAKKLLDVYGSSSNIDVWLGGIVEPPVANGKVGPLFSCLIAKQFQNMRDGDRFWWENEGVFTAAQKEALKSISLSQIICKNTHIDEVPLNAFIYQKYPQGFKKCDTIPKLDLSAWKEDFDSYFYE